MKSIKLFDTTLRDGTQRRGISLSALDKIKICGLLDQFGIHYIEGGWPGSNPKDQEFFERMRKSPAANARLVAFGSTRRKGKVVSDDLNVQALLRAETPAVAVVGKSWDLHVARVLETTAAENQAMIAETVAFLRERGREVIYDAEHFFDGFKDNKAHALQSVRAAVEGGAAWIVFCDTNGGTLPSEIEVMVRESVAFLRSNGFEGEFGIHTHNDAELAIANSLAGIAAGCTQVQGTINGYGERCGNANLVSLIPTLELKLGLSCVGSTKLPLLTQLSRSVSEIVNVAFDTQAPYVGTSAFAHKGGIHVAAVEKIARSYEHIDPKLVGNAREVLVSELSGRGNLRMFGEQAGLKPGLRGQIEVESALSEVKDLEAKGYEFESAGASLELLLRRKERDYVRPFELLDVLVLSEMGSERQGSGIGGLGSKVQATVKVRSSGGVFHTVAQGAGPVHAIDGAIRKALEGEFPALRGYRLVDYKVRILDPEQATAAVTRVMIEAQYEGRSWVTVGCSSNIIEASCLALSDSIEYLLRVVEVGSLQPPLGGPAASDLTT